jgi:hypothetical protein
MRTTLKALLPLLFLGTTCACSSVYAFAPAPTAGISQRSSTLATYRDARDYAYVARRADAYEGRAERYYYSAPAIGYAGPPPYQYAPPPALWYASPPVMLMPVRPASCGRYHYWNGERCADARYDPPYVGPRW